jgi:hypothetical protein
MNIPRGCNAVAQIGVHAGAQIGYTAILLLLLFVAAAAAKATDTRLFVSAQALAINTAPAVPIIAQLNNTTTVQMYIRGSSTAQIFTVTLVDGTTIEVPSGATLTLKFASNLLAADRIGTVVSATGACVLQVISIREVKE